MVAGKLAKKYEIKSQLIGPRDSDDKELKILNRIIRWTPAGIEYEPDQRHADMIVRDPGLTEANAVNTAGEYESRALEEEGEELYGESESTRYRALAARANYLAADRPDIMYATKEICRSMAKPTQAAWGKVKRLGRYLQGSRRTAFKYEWQGDEEEVIGYTDSDWVGCRATGKSTSGGAICVGTHFIKRVV